MSVALKSEVFIESKNIRNQYIDRTGVLDKVKELVLLPDGEHMTIKTVSEFYEVDYSAIGSILARHKKEFVDDGIHTITSKNEAFGKLQKALSPGQFVVKLLTRRAVLRIGMLLRDSEVAAEVRRYLLDIENESTKEQKDIVVGQWSDSEIVKLTKILDRETEKGTNRMSAVKEAAKELNRKPQNVYFKVNSIEKKFGSLEKYIIKNNIVYLNQESEEYANNVPEEIEVACDNKESLNDMNEQLTILEQNINNINKLHEKLIDSETQLVEHKYELRIANEKISKLNKIISKYKNENENLKSKLKNIKSILVSNATDNESDYKEERPSHEYGSKYKVDNRGMVSRR
ncbi:hypothetical protein ACH6EH_06850 [Paenibacillus sp. JSM ZJ436]|uniref:hypothetical protein n=1 Tax=Paenibacillus sp. JSM ZJ436 TaxID=3376190 RepID=UPI0037A2F135